MNFRTLAFVSLLILAKAGVAETWPSLERFVADCELILLAKAVPDPGPTPGFEVLETWKGRFDTNQFWHVTAEGRLSHLSCQVTNGQQVVLCFTRYNRTMDGKYGGFSAAFAVKEGKILYAETSEEFHREYRLDDFKKRVLEASAKPQWSNSIEYIQKTERLWGVSQVRLTGEDGVTLVDAVRSGYGRGLTMFDSAGKPVERVTLKRNQECSLSDGHHAFLKYRLKSVQDGAACIAVTERFDARSFGGDSKERTETICVQPYAEAEE